MYTPLKMSPVSSVVSLSLEVLSLPPQPELALPSSPAPWLLSSPVPLHFSFRQLNCQTTSNLLNTHVFFELDE
jgi:hypothetical protein